MQQLEIEPIVGQYVSIELLGKHHRIYVERSGAGVPLLCLHTAGSDSRQYRAVQNDPKILEHFEVICFDLPYHGKSSPPVGWQNTTYSLSASDYSSIVIDFCNALGLVDPVLMGCSIGGRLVADMAISHSSRFSGLIGLQSGTHVPPYYDSTWLDHPEVHGGRACAAAVSGLVGPSATDADRYETLWHYMQSGPGVFKGDLHFYNHDSDGDLRERIAEQRGTNCPLYLLTGEFDYSCSPDDTVELGKGLPDADVRIMPGIGHFPMSSDPQLFIEHLRPVLDEILEAR